MAAAKKDSTTCLKAIEELPQQEDWNEKGSDEGSKVDLHEMLVPAALKQPWTNLDSPVLLNAYYIRFTPDPNDRVYKEFGLFVKEPLPTEAEKMELDLHLPRGRGRSVMTTLVPSGITQFDKDEVMLAQHFQEMFFKVILDREKFIPEFVALGMNDSDKSSSSTFYLLLPVIFHDYDNTVSIEWKIVKRCLSSPVFRAPADAIDKEILPSGSHLQLANGCWSISDVENSLVYATHKKLFYFITNIVHGKNGNRSRIPLRHPEQPLLRAKGLFRLHNLLHKGNAKDSESRQLPEHFINLPPELCQLKIIGFSKDIGSSLSLLPSIMHRLENLLVAIELKHMFSASFTEGGEVSAHRVLEALTTKKCQEHFSLKRLETLGDAFLKFAVSRQLFLLPDTLDVGELTTKRSNAVKNPNLFKLAPRRNLQVYIRDQSFDPCQVFALGRPCPIICSKETEATIHSQSRAADQANASEARCSKGHNWLPKETIADVVEALVGAFIVDSGFRAATAFLRWMGIQVDFEASQVTNVCMASKSYMPLNAEMDTATNMAAIENLLGYQFIHRGLLLQAFLHPSSNKHRGGGYQGLEFLGDSVLDYLITSYLFSVYPKLNPGHLTILRSVLVNNKAFANVAADRCFHKFLICDPNNSMSVVITNYVDFIKTTSSERELFEGPRRSRLPFVVEGDYVGGGFEVLADLVESCFGAVLLDTGFNLNCVWKIMLSFLDPTKAFSSFLLDPSMELRELCQSHGWDLLYTASDNGRNFSVEAKVSGKDDCLAASASNVNKNDATKIAAQLILAKLEAQGFIPKSKSLKEILKSTPKAEAILIGYDETPIDVDIPDATGFENLKMQEPFGSNFNQNTHPINEATNICSPCIIDVSRQLSSQSEVVEGQPSENVADSSSDTDSQIAGGLHTKSARSHLDKICAANSWKPPSFECCKDEGPSHLKLFTFKVILEIEEAPDSKLECFGAPQKTKKAAAEHAAEGALRYLEHAGYLRYSN